MMGNRSRLEHATRLFEMPEPALDRLMRRRARKRLRQRIAAGLSALLISAIAIGALVRAYEPTRVPGQTTPSPDPTQEVDPAIRARFQDPWNGPWPAMTRSQMEATQARADAGNVKLAWQVDYDQEGLAAERFVHRALGWAGSRNAAVNYVPRNSEQAWEARVVEWYMIRCGGGPNPLYAGDDCAPTIDDTRYQQVIVRAEQLVTRGRGGIWFVTGVRDVEPYVQAVPRTQEEARALMTTFLEARLAGSGAETMVECCQSFRLIELNMYETSGGSPYARYEFRVMDVPGAFGRSDPEWPSGTYYFRVTLVAEDGTSVEEWPYRVGPASDRKVVGCCYFQIRERAP